MPSIPRKKKFQRALYALLALTILAAISFFTWVPALVMKRLNPTIDPGPYTIPEPAATLHKTLFVADMHSDALLWGRDLLKRDTRGHIDIPRLIEGNVALQFFTAVTRSPAQKNINATKNEYDLITPLVIAQGWPLSTWLSPLQRAMNQAVQLNKIVIDSKGTFTLLRTQESLDRYRARRDKDPAITAGILGVEGLHCLEGNMVSMQLLFNVGYRMMAPTHFFDNDLGGSAHGIEKGGLTPFGRDVMKFMRQLNILVDLAHASPKVFDEILAMGGPPVVVSHTGVRGTCDNARNLSDAQLLAIADTGGLIGIGFWDTAVCGNDVNSIVEAIKYTADLIGVEHVALGSDFDGTVTTPFDASGIPLITAALLKAGFDEKEVRRIMGDNVLRVLREVLPAESDPPAPLPQP